MSARSPAKTPSASAPTSAPTRASSKNIPSGNNKKSVSIERIEKVPVKSRKNRTQGLGLGGWSYLPKPLGITIRSSQIIIYTSLSYYSEIFV